MGQLRIVGGSGSVEFRASNTTQSTVLEVPNILEGTIAVLPSGANPPWLVTVMLQ